MGVATPMILNDEWQARMAERSGDQAVQMSPRRLPIEMLEPSDVTNAVMWLVSDEARAVTGITLPIDAGTTCP